MAQAGIHGLVGTAVRRWMPDQEWLMTGIVLGSLFPDLDNFAVAAAVLTGNSTEGLHRTFTHSLFLAAFIWGAAWVYGRLTGRTRWRNLGVGLGIGILLHILLDLLVWFNGVYLLWPLPVWLNLWENVTPPAWWMQLMMPAEFLAFALFFAGLGWLACRQNSDLPSIRSLKVWTAVQFLLFLIFTALFFTMRSGFFTIYGGVYLLSLLLALGITLKMRQTIEG
ncbi:MAG TPA: hypothetical protein EYH05_01875 [Anaerolineae bacterium]|nr:hypothetical protein [Anaerolineae bacterium]